MASFTLALVGCNNRSWPERYPTRVKVLYEGRPAAGVTVVLTPIDKIGNPGMIPSTALVEADGSASFTTYTKNDGVPAGEYVVTAFWIDVSGKNDRNRLPERYNDPATSTHKIRIEKDINDLGTINLTK